MATTQHYHIPVLQDEYNLGHGVLVINSKGLSSCMDIFLETLLVVKALQTQEIYSTT